MLNKSCGAIRISKIRSSEATTLFGEKFPLSEWAEVKLSEGRFIEDVGAPMLKPCDHLVSFAVSYEALGAALLGRLVPATITTWESKDIPPLVEPNLLERIVEDYKGDIGRLLTQVEAITKEILSLKGDSNLLAILSRLSEINRVLRTSGPSLIERFQKALELSR